MLLDFRIKPPLRDSEDNPEVTLAPEYARYDSLYGHLALMNLTVDDLLQDMETSAVVGILQSEHDEHAWGSDEEWNDRVASIIHAHPDRFVCGFAGVDPRRGMPAVREIDRAYHELGLRGVVFEPALLQISPTDAICYPIYAKCVELGIPVGFHTGINFASHGPLLYERPVLIDQVACHFPELVIICHHGGWPWPMETVAVAWKHANVYVEFGAISPKYIANSGGWGDTVHFINSVIREKVLWGTDWPMLRYERTLTELEALPLKESARDAYLGGNARRLLDRIL